MIIGARFNGPPGSGNGGYSAGLLAAELGTGPAEVTLRKPPPLGVEFRLSHDGPVLRALDGETVIAEARPLDEPAPSAVPPVSPAEAEQAAKAYPGFADHPFPTCYVCGHARDDGMGIFPGPVGDGRVAAPWTVADGPGQVTLWAALDCPGGWSVISEGRPYVLGRLAVWVDALPSAGDACVVLGRHVGGEGRKADVLSTVYGPGGDRLATARATWIAI
ncbi:hypothetical protein KZZ52_20940 [Dactylosporangium sp. AC04546]|uniref:hypothetical protein n=1 Tax=Dactylosporangium sp. AC04546 TaxID=2862460 RepID=UPI001EE0A933|nr:hypothetical protein [Dactylosporangium sp. AC04546]WVK87753.1 hypothetical protein KZZ52_20940 [Dactylosporangium sp. AC04546]